MAKWYVRRDEKVAGPVDSFRLELLATSRGLLPTDELAQDLAGPWWLAGDTTLFPEPIQTTSESAPDSPQSNPTQTNWPIRVGGWLLFFCVMLTILRPMFFLVSLVLSFGLLSVVDFETHAGLKVALIWDQVGSAALITYGLIVGYKIWHGHQQGREIAKHFLLINVLGSLVVAIVGGLIIASEKDSEVLLEGVLDSLRFVVQALIFFAIWWAYFKKSKRVLITYGLQGLG